MQSLTSQIPVQELEEGQLNYDQINQGLQEEYNLNQSPSTLQLKRSSIKGVRISSMSSIKSKGQFIKVSKNNNLKVKQKSVKAESNNQISWKKQCRICLQDQSEGRIIKPCKCTGSMQFAHEHCLCEWIKRKIDLKSRGKFRCQVCDQPFDYKVNKRLSLDCDHLKANYQIHRSTYRCFLIFMICLFIMWITIVILVGIGLNKTDGGWINKYIMDGEQVRIVFFCVIFIYLLIMVFVTLLFIAEYGIRTQLFIKSIQNYSKKPKRPPPRLYFIV